MMKIMVVGTIVNTGIRIAQAALAGGKVFAQYESKVYTGLYGAHAGRGVRHGLAAGGAIGSFINSGGSENGNGQIPKGNGAEAGSKDQAYKRSGSNSYSRKRAPSNCYPRYRYSYSRRGRKRSNR